MKPAWFRRPDGVLVAATAPSELSLFLASDYEPVATEEAEAEVKAGEQAKLNAARARDDQEAKERRLAEERLKAAEERRRRVRANLADAGVQVGPHPDEGKKPAEDKKPKD